MAFQEETSGNMHGMGRGGKHMSDTTSTLHGVKHIEIVKGATGGHKVIHHMEGKMRMTGGSMSRGMVQDGPHTQEHYFSNDEDPHLLHHVHKIMGLDIPKHLAKGLENLVGGNEMEHSAKGEAKSKEDYEPDYES